ncbi:MAG: YqiA/YcfP family alpha/beta fold hydrolase [Halanaerobiales bacterium]|nr:YqiA/YcfP family alpha/beta fold hydrolase [Halanaerobiales bacterium]
MVYSKKKIDNDFVKEDRFVVNDIPVLRFQPKTKQKKLPTILYYHGWSSNKEFQRFKANVMAMYGYQVIVPDSKYHGERNSIDFTKENTIEKYLLKTVYSSIKEAPLIIDFIKDLSSTDQERISIIGNSMGGFTSSGLFFKYQLFKTLVVFNGACAWQKVKTFIEENHTERNLEYQEELVKYDPDKNLDKINERPILMLHGDNDTAIPIEVQRYFYKKASEFYEEKNKIRLIEVPRMNHYISLGMLENAISFNKDYL